MQIDAMTMSDPSKDDTLAISFLHGSSNLTSDDHTRPLRTFLFGYPISHSLAPRLHAKLFKGLSLPWSYTLLESQQEDEFLPALHQSDVVGCAVTMPYKVKMISAVDALTDEARAIGAINTIFKRRRSDGSQVCIGTNTDTIGVREAFVQNVNGVVQDARGKPAMVIGGGGACRAAIYALWKWMGAQKIYLVNRLASEVDLIVEDFRKAEVNAKMIHVSSVQEAQSLETPFLVVGTVPDYPPKEEGEFVARDIIMHFLSRKDKGCILEMCYHPKPRTIFFTLGEQHGWRMIYGTEAMIWQGVAQQVLWAEISLQKFKVAEAKQAVDEALN
jgi:quinate dehydrogenase